LLSGSTASTEVWRRLAEFETKSNRPQAALKAWRQLAKLETSPVGRCPAVPELVDTNYAVAHAALAQQAAKQKQWSQAIEQYRQAEDIFKKYEASKTTVQYQSMEYMGGVNKREERQLAQLRIDLLHQQSKAYQAMGEPMNSERVEKLANELSQKENSQ
jgi:tetratricopeptide (TPR) repeat protein